MENEFPSNSNKQKEAREPAVPKDVQRVVQNGVQRRKKPLGKRFAELFSGASAKDVAGHVVLDIIVPASKDLLADALREQIEGMLFGSSRSPSRRGARSHGGPNGFVNYGSQSSSRYRDEPRAAISKRGRANHDFDEIVLETRVEADEVIDTMFEMIDRYDAVTLAELYKLVGERGEPVDNKWGWTDFRGAKVVMVRNGYVLDLPRPIPLD